MALPEGDQEKEGVAVADVASRNDASAPLLVLRWYENSGRRGQVELVDVHLDSNLGQALLNDLPSRDPLRVCRGERLEGERRSGRYSSGVE